MEKTNLTWDEILYRRSWSNIRRGLADSPRLVRSSANGKTKKKIKGLDELPNRK
ncbi:hypothetical protein [Sphingobacterium multivorum]|uniref:hypothetical protein n=1 Tax=Sphingobacterium multivorum TaxID=28454 RepID=UPI0028A702B1|nr:hypothetical protein [Sphingobacterium multivorum]